jgi:hypothetical protein
MRVRLWAVVLILAFSATEASAQGTISWSEGSPSTAGSGALSVQGTIVLDPGWSYLNGCNPQVTITVWQDGLVQQQFTTGVMKNVGSGAFGPYTVSGLTPGATYNVIVEVTVTGACDVETLATDAKQCMAGN